LNCNYNKVNHRGAITICPSAEAKFLRINIKDFRFVETAVKQWLINQDKNFQEGTVIRLLPDEKPQFRNKKKNIGRGSWKA